MTSWQVLNPCDTAGNAARSAAEKRINRVMVNRLFLEKVLKYSVVRQVSEQINISFSC
jgi:hypothetical protein